MENSRNHIDFGGSAGDRIRQPVVGCENLKFSYGAGRFSLFVPFLEIAAGSKVALVGPSGCGKTTLINLIAGILKPQGGSLQVGGVDLGQNSERDLSDFRIITMGLIFQEFKLLQYLKVQDNILLPYRLNPVLEHTAELKKRAADLARQAGLGDGLDRYPKELSQGERQRVALCRALITSPSLLLCDEPTANLDPDNRDRILDMLFEYCSNQQASLVMITHDPDVLERFDQTIDIPKFLTQKKSTAL